MKLSVSQPVLKSALSIVSRAVSSRTTMPVLSNVLLSVDGESLRLSATNREISINVWIPATVEDIGMTTLPARLLSDFVNNLPPERIDMELTTRTETMRLQCAKNNANIKGIAADDFPIIPAYTPDAESTLYTAGNHYTLEPGHLYENINAVTFAAATDENRPTLTGVETTFDDGRLTMGATDGYRMAMRACDAVFQTDKNTVVIPARSLAEVARICGDAVGIVNVVISGNRNQALFSATGKKEWQRVDMVSELIDAKFPDYRATIPKRYNTRITVDTAAMVKALRVALLFGRDNADLVNLAVGKDSVCVSAHSGESGDNLSTVEATIEGAPLEIRFNARLLIDAFEHISAPQSIVELTVPTRPATIRPMNDDNYLQVVMPMHPPR